MVDQISPFQKDVAELLVDLSEFLRRINPNPFVAIVVLDIIKDQMLNEGVFLINIGGTDIGNKEVREFYEDLWEFIREFNPTPLVTVAVLNIAKFQFLKEITKLG